MNTSDGQFTYYLAGTQKPTVVFESGLGDDMTSWTKVIDQVAEVAQVFAYNRAGFSGSESKNSARSGAVIVAELKSLLKSAKLAPPYVLVGHSIGGAYMELYAKTYPEDVAGVVLVDPNSSKYPQYCKQAKLDLCEPPSSMPKWATLFFPAAVEGEIIGFRATHSQLNAKQTFPNVPLAVLSATHRDEMLNGKEKQGRELYIKMQQDLARLSPRSTFISCDSCSHYIHNDEPNLVINAVKWVLAKAKFNKT